MNEKMFNELIASIEEGGAILRGEIKPSRQFHIDSVDVKRIRENYKLTQVEFARMLGISKKTLQNWEQGRRQPVGPARVLLLVAENYPDAVLNTVKELACV